MTATAKQQRTNGRPVTIIVTGGGSGGHITPNLAIAHELKTQNPKVKVVYIGQKGDKLIDVPAQSPDIDQVHTVRAGKLRRYHGEGLRQLLDLPTDFKNIRDALWTLIGLCQSFWLLRRLKPDAIFIKGGFVGVPVGLAAAMRHIPYITHDSDALPGLANRIIARWARLHAVALPKEVYNYPPAKTVTVGVPIAREYHLATTKEVEDYRRRLGLSAYKRVLLETGGGNGAQRLNGQLAACVPALLERYPDLAVIQLAGRDHEAALRQQYQRELAPKDQKRVIVHGFVTNLYEYSAVADLVIARGSGNTLAELAAQAKPCIVVPNPQLTGGHQIKNAKALAERKAVKMIDEAALMHDPLVLMAPITELLDHPDRAQELGRRLAQFAVYDTAQRLAMLLLEVA